MTDSSYPIPN